MKKEQEFIKECEVNKHNFKVILIETNVNPRGDNMKTVECTICRRQMWKFN